MIPGLDIQPEVEKKIWADMEGWADFFKDRIRRDGIFYLLQEYRELVYNLEKQSCPHGPKGERLQREDYLSCCGISYEYLNDISCRNALQIMLNHLPEDEKDLLFSKLLPLDERLKALQEGEEFLCNPLVQHKYPKSIYFWYYGLPRGVDP